MLARESEYHVDLFVMDELAQRLLGQRHAFSVAGGDVDAEVTAVVTEGHGISAGVRS